MTLTVSCTATAAAGSHSPRLRTFTVGGRLSLSQKEAPKFRLDEVDYDCTDGGDIHTTSEDQSPVMWIVTEDRE